ncbi:hypothetical protein [Veronia nyctiphanis]|uniref:hypothetical protein n=1 Tax=Veronia nyctiphanis TaxID=1278244 RepID=UPI00100BB295|nr:hypothetical protein [Veronia nyctiphanis]
MRGTADAIGGVAVAASDIAFGATTSALIDAAIPAQSDHSTVGAFLIAGTQGELKYNKSGTKPSVAVKDLQGLAGFVTFEDFDHNTGTPSNVSQPRGPVQLGSGLTNYNQDKEQPNDDFPGLQWQISGFGTRTYYDGQLITSPDQLPQQPSNSYGTRADGTWGRLDRKEEVDRKEDSQVGFTPSGHWTFEDGHWYQDGVKRTS